MGTIKTTNIETITGSGTLTLGQSGETITIPSGVTITNNGTQTGFGGDNTPSFKAHLASNQTISSGSFTKAQLATEIWDTDNAYDNSTNYRFTVPSGEDGKYVFTYTFLFYNLTSGNIFEARLYKNGSSIGGSTFRETGQATTAQVDNSRTTIVNLSAGDYIELFVNQTTGSNQTLYGPNNGDTSLTGYKLIGV